MSTEEHLTKWAKLSDSIKRAGAKSYAFVAVDDSGEVFYGEDYGHRPELILAHLNTMRRSVKQYIERQAKLASLPPELPPRPSTPAYDGLSDEAIA